jgi:hypothetical protein
MDNHSNLGCYLSFRSKSSSADVLLKLNYDLCIGFQCKDVKNALSLSSFQEELDKMHASDKRRDIFVLTSKSIGFFEYFAREGAGFLQFESGIYHRIGERMMLKENVDTHFLERLYWNQSELEIRAHDKINSLLNIGVSLVFVPKVFHGV